jgi:NAD(P)-dependent dehydrogenase (short-subunit alcohol dehydrogenase family)
MGALSGRTIVIVGATSGLGWGLCELALAGGADVVAAGRRPERLADLEARGAQAVPVDVTDPAACRRLAEELAQKSAPPDAVVDCAGSARLRRLAELEREDWDQVLGSGPIGANNLIAALVPVLAPGTVLAFLSSDAAFISPYALGAYAAAKAALEAVLHGWRVERPDLRFCTLALGPTFPTEFGHGFDPALLEEATQHWDQAGFPWDRLADAAEVSGFVLDVVVSLLAHPGLSVEHLLVRSPAARAGASERG